MNKIYKIKIIQPEFDKISYQYCDCKNGAGGDGGSIEIYAREIIGTGSIEANGGDGSVGGRGGNVKLVTEDATELGGRISVQGGSSQVNSVIKEIKTLESKQPVFIGNLIWLMLYPINLSNDVTRKIDNKFFKFLIKLITVFLSYLIVLVFIIIFIYKLLLK